MFRSLISNMSQISPPNIETLPSAEHFCTTMHKFALTSMQWTILNFNLLKFDSEHCLKSSCFESVQNGVSTGTWHMKLVTESMYANDGRIALFFVLPGYRPGLSVGLEAWIVDADGKVANKKKICYELDASEVGFHNFIHKSGLVDSLLPNGNLTIHCFVAVIPLDSRQVTAGKPVDDNVPLIEIWPKGGCSNLLKDLVFSDAVLVCEDKRFHVHKCILSARSSVFREKFQTNVEDVNVDDMDAHILKSLLSYIYTDKVHGKCTVDMAAKLLKVAENYRLLELRVICEEFLETNVTVHNLLEVALTADLHNLDPLKEVCINFMYEQGREVVSSCNSKDFFKTVPHYLLNGVFKKIFEGSESLLREQPPTSKASLTSLSEPFGTSKASLTSLSEPFGTSRSSLTSTSGAFATSRPGLTSLSEPFATSRPGLTSISEPFATSRPSLTSISEPFATASSPGLRDGKQQAMVKGTQSSQFATSFPLHLHNAMGQPAVTSSEFSTKQPTFLFGLSEENRPVLSSPKKKKC